MNRRVTDSPDYPGFSAAEVAVSPDYPGYGRG